ncbi:hypothetical protein P4O66_017941 [Electrophorus voltai]|uniref:Uncharacterized protein n=1 Tax=Electrophorus voltai TaxID=2609070 RepID=A0AAD9DMW8_9TELE|nr:hypothetical protein P4O66_017941 [Electrophorus voltai]
MSERLPSLPLGVTEYKVMPYGLSVAPSVFQAFIVLQEEIGRFVIAYMTSSSTHLIFGPTQSKTPKPVTPRKLMTERSWSHIDLDFITDLPCSEDDAGNALCLPTEEKLRDIPIGCSSTLSLLD